MLCGDISGVVLAGGENKRFGGKLKANSIVDGEKIINRIINTIYEIFDEIIIVTNTPDEFSELTNCRFTGDYFKGVGPLGGIHAAMKNSSKEAIFVFAGDMPFLSRKLIMRQIGFFYDNPSDAVIPEREEGIEPLHGIFLSALADKLEEHIRNTDDYNTRKFLNKINVSYYTPHNKKEAAKAFTNINAPSDTGPGESMQ